MESKPQLSKKAIAMLMLLTTLGYRYSVAQSTTLSLNEAVQLSLSNSKLLKASSAKLIQSQAQTHEMQWQRFPEIKATGSYLRMNNPNLDMQMSLGGGNGGSGTANPVHVDQAMYSMVNASIPVFAGFKINSGIASAKYLEQATALDLEHDKNKVIQNTIGAYYNLYKAQAAVFMVKENLKQAQQRVTEFSNLEKNGLIARNDLLKVQLQESNVSLLLLDAENNLSTANYNMDLMLGFADTTHINLESIVMPRNTVLSEGMLDWELKALNHRSDYLATQERLKASHAGVKAAQGDYYPSVAITGGYVAAKIPNVLTLINAINAGIGLSYNLSNLYKNGSKVKYAKAQEDQVYWSSQLLNDEIKSQIHQYYQNYIEALKKIEVYAVAVTQANENYRITRNKYDNALATTTELLDADVAKLQSNINYEYAKADAEVAYSKLYEVAGVLSEQYPTAGHQ
jgi:outer membrane protein